MHFGIVLYLRFLMLSDTAYVVYNDTISDHFSILKPEYIFSMSEPVSVPSLAGISKKGNPKTTTVIPHFNYSIRHISNILFV